MFQIPHLATSYAAVNAIVTLQNEVALQSIDINALKEFLYKMKQKDGSFHMHEGGETDVRYVCFVLFFMQTFFYYLKLIYHLQRSILCSFNSFIDKYINK